ncbi:MAG: flagellar filament capping protein FliD [Lachnospiraceae bacterium]|nr:flagellar filament capping protein FliD [Lachnospiraceae bacterium]
MSINALLGGASRSSSNYWNSISQNLITQSTSMDTQVYHILQQLNSDTSSSETVSEAYADIDTFLKTYQSDLNELKQTSVNLMTDNRQGVFSQYEEGKLEVDDVVSAVEDFVKSYNSVTSLLKNNEGRGTGTASHLSSFTRGIGAEQSLKLVGITCNTDGKLTLDSEALKKALEEEYDQTSSLIGGQYGIADRASTKAEQALGDSVQRIVNHDLSSLISNTQSFDSIQYTHNFNKAGVHNLNNMYVVGLFVNTMA